MNTPPDAIECGPLVDPTVRIEQLVRIQRDREAGRVDFGEDEWTWRVRDVEQALFLLARGHRPVRVMRGVPRMCPEVWFFWLAAKGELEHYWAASRMCTGFRR
jgi:hypothetical protein